jgi:hypothetical protein
MEEYFIIMIPPIVTTHLKTVHLKIFIQQEITPQQLEFFMQNAQLAL